MAVHMRKKTRISSDRAARWFLLGNDKVTVNMKQREKQKDDRKRETIGGSNDKKKGEQMIVHDYKHGIIGEGKKEKKKHDNRNSKTNKEQKTTKPKYW